MKNKPSFKSFIKGSFPRRVKYLVFEEEQENKIFKEKNAFRTRILFEIFLILLPVFAFIAIKLIKFEMQQILLFTLGYSALYVSIPLLYIFRYTFIQFEEIGSVKYAEKEWIKPIEIGLLIIGVILTLSLYFFLIVQQYTIA
ncbi:MAG: hypothetical protein JXN65_02115 [Clostridia bacterium]|nr:hypothetical protein [Clostridia bacterium]